MAYNETLAARVREKLTGEVPFEEKKMFGGVGFLVNGNMACGVNKDDLIVRVGSEENDAALARPHARPFDMTGRPMAGWILVEAGGCEEESTLSEWVKIGLDFALSPPPK